MRENNDFFRTKTLDKISMSRVHLAVNERSRKLRAEAAKKGVDRVSAEPCVDTYVVMQEILNSATCAVLPTRSERSSRVVSWPRHRTDAAHVRALAFMLSFSSPAGGHLKNVCRLDIPAMWKFSDASVSRSGGIPSS